MTIAVDMGRQATKQTKNKQNLAVLQYSQAKCMSASFCGTYSRTNTLRALRQKNPKENEHVGNLVFVVAAALRPCDIVRQSCGVLCTTPQDCRKKPRNVVV